MKRIPTAVCGLMMLVPLSAASVHAQSTTPHSSTAASKPAQSTAPAPKQSTPAQSAAAASADPNAPPPPAHPITTEQTREMLDLMGYKKMEDEGWKQLVANNQQRAPFIPQDVWTDVQGGLSSIDYVAILQPVYAKFLSTEDAAKALEFYRTPAGKRVLQAMPSVLGESVAVSQQKGQQVGREAISKHQAEIQEAEKKYQAEHAPAGGPTGEPGAVGGPGAGAPTSSGPSTAPGSKTGNAPSTTPGTKPSTPSTTPPPPQR
jgi:hypothetical protein